jgi:gamma-glutamylcyclotransferase
VLYFAFGSNLSIAQMRERCPGSEPVGPALLDGRALGFSYYSQNFPPGGAADVVGSEGAQVWGALYRLTEQDLARLDRFEHVGNGGYRRIEIEVEHESGPVEALCYEVAERLDFEVAPTAEYRLLMLDGSLEHGLPDTWLGYLERRFLELDRQAVSTEPGEQPVGGLPAGDQGAVHRCGPLGAGVLAGEDQSAGRTGQHGPVTRGRTDRQE